MSNEVFVTVTGWVARRPEIRVAHEGAEWAVMRVASTPRRRTRDGQWTDGRTEWFEVKAWGDLAQNLVRSVAVGQPVVVHGRLATETWQTEQGTERTSLVVHALTVGHDLSRGRADFVRVRHEAPVVGAEEPPAEHEEAPQGTAVEEAPAFASA